MLSWEGGTRFVGTLVILEYIVSNRMAEAEFGRKRLWPILGHYSVIRLEGL